MQVAGENSDHKISNSSDYGGVCTLTIETTVALRTVSVPPQ